MPVAPEADIPEASAEANGSRIALLLAGLALLAPALGGATSLWSQAAMMIITGVLFIMAPPSRSLGLVVNLLAVSLIVIAAGAFLPSHWTALPEWRRIIEGLHAPLPGTRSAQPWLTLEGCALLLLGGAWAYYLLQYPWSREEQSRATRLFGVWALGLAALAVGAFLLHLKVPFWPHVRNSPIEFGFFPNRNQTASVLALAGIVVAALAMEEWREGKKTALFWFAGLGLVAYALVIDSSRAGIVLLFGGMAVWAVGSIRFAGKKKSAALNCAAAALLFTGLFLFGGDTLKRFSKSASAETPPYADFRMPVQEDALELSMQTPVLGVGLGNFEPLFAISRNHSGHEGRALHPESDWLWTAVEMGWVAPLAVLAAFGFWIARCLPLDRRSRRVGRLAAVVCGIGFALHALVDVPAHRLGSLWPALFLMSTALNPKFHRPARRWVAPTFRFLGFAFVAIGILWTISAAGALVLPTSAELVRIEKRIDAAITDRDYPRMRAAANAGLRIAPLNANLFRQRALAEAASLDATAAIDDFRVFRRLDPNWAPPCFDEGAVWLALGRPEYALEAWKETIARSRKDGPIFYARMLELAGHNIAVREKLRRWSRISPAYFLSFLGSASHSEFLMETDELWSAEPDLKDFSPEQIGLLFTLWEQKGNPDSLAQTIRSRREWLPFGWRFLARYHAERGEFREAYALVEELAPKPKTVSMPSRLGRAELERTYFYHPEDIVTGLALYGAQESDGKLEAALETIRTVKKQKNAPDYVPALEAELCARLREWDAAWKAWSEGAAAGH